MTVAQGTPRCNELWRKERTSDYGLIDSVVSWEELARKLEAENAALSAQVVELQTDAERYRCLRDEVMTGRNLDKTIDDFMTLHSDIAVPPSVKDV